jgi:hypothetical protein
MNALWAEDADIVEQAIVMWNAIHHVIATYRDDHPEWSFIRHEDLSAAPEQGFRALYDKLGLSWSDRVATGLSKATSEANPSEVSVRRHGSVRRDSAATATVWTKRLSPEEIQRIRTGTAAVARLFYSDQELGL